MYLRMLHKLVQSAVVESTEGLPAKLHGSWTCEYWPVPACLYIRAAFSSIHKPRPTHSS